VLIQTCVEGLTHWMTDGWILSWLLGVCHYGSLFVEVPVGCCASGLWGCRVGYSGWLVVSIWLFVHFESTCPVNKLG